MQKRGSQSQGGISGKILEGKEILVLKLILKAYKKMCEERCYPEVRHEVWFSAVLEGYIDRLCPEYERLTRHHWHVMREKPNDDERIRTGQSDPKAAPRIDIVITCWKGLGGQRMKFPFESKRLAENDSDLIRWYIQKGLKDRYLNEAKDYSAGLSWGGMIGYILQGSHYAIVDKLNDQVNKQLSGFAEHLVIDQPIEGFDAIYRSRHQLTSDTDILTIVHLFLPFLLEEAHV